ncbi:hypothetical protein SCATT_02940 [Streptantibioticus cattleyicolor NRRL 8057 = DSM 46488]|uniref:Uncharacterized protein n=1 Tax=Streptantibioticus cattleyicolor (strain ATCC 35852 / DSM 46488 / JCM 4925 / NBRC 14057 / NRRL 8057) TaxID=1003195 RepID=G8WMU6_STREN|nr:hypothetical protein SCATT_02940 [Streptantibioticus cattleyicolor NRRL 8057 = DSM 46488]
MAGLWFFSGAAQFGVGVARTEAPARRGGVEHLVPVASFGHSLISGLCLL